jgi:hypothetical protein
VQANDKELYKNIEIFGIFPIVVYDKVTYVLIVAPKNSKNFDAKLIDMILKSIDILSFSFEKLELQKEDEKLRNELVIT